MLRFGYNTNGFAHHKLFDIFEIIATLGYNGVALTLDNYHCNPYTSTLNDLLEIKSKLSSLSLDVVIETGARYFLDKWHKHEPTLISKNGRNERIKFLKSAIDIANILEAQCVTFFSGSLKDGVNEESAWKWLIDGCSEVIKYAEKYGIVMAFEPEPGMFIEKLDSYDKLKNQINSNNLKLCLDIGHIYCVEDISAEEVIKKYHTEIKTIHLEDIKGKNHYHLKLGEGDIDFVPILKTLKEINYNGLVNLELSRSSYEAPTVAEESMKFLQSLLKDI